MNNTSTASKFQVAGGKWLTGQPLATAIILYGIEKFNAAREANQDWVPDLAESNLSGVILERANFKGANLDWVILDHARLCWSDFEGAQIHRSNLNEADLTGTNFTNAAMTGVVLTGARLYNATLKSAALLGAKLAGATLTLADFSGATGLTSPSRWLKDNFEQRPDGFVVYKAQKGVYPSPDHWKWQPGALLTEVVNRMPTDMNGCGVHFGTKQFVSQRYSIIWRALIKFEDLAGVVVPYNTHGGARCERLQLLERI